MDRDSRAVNRSTAGRSAETRDDEGRFLKRDLFGTIRRCTGDTFADYVERDTTTAPIATRWLARRLAAREARALLALRAVPSIPRLLAWDGRRLQRTWLPGVPLHQAGGVDRTYFHEASRLLRRIHAAGVVHNDLAKEPNWLVTPEGLPALVDFQLASRPRYRDVMFKMLAHDDLRHLLKHKRTYCPQHLTQRERAILQRRSPVAGLWARTGKPVYRFVTRRLLGWADREGAGERTGS
jgi:RIO-like serine/threonine protein kinase